MNTHDYQNETYEQSIAVVGMAGTYHGAATLDQLWDNLKEGYEAVRFLDEDTLKANGCPRSMREHPMFVPASAMLRDVSGFDAEFFGYTTAEATLMDPQLRLMLQTAWHAFENANLAPDRLEGLTGVFAGGHRSDYLLCNLGPEYSIMTGMQALTASLFNGQDYLSTWISYKLGLTGPSVNVQTACSTGLVAVATACQSLQDYSCDTALAITSAIFSPRHWGYLAETGSILSGDGHCRPYDADAVGTITGEGVGAVILKRLHDALEQGDNVLGVIRGYTVNNDGALRAGYAAPSAAGQQALITQALANAGMRSGDISYIEGHGTGTHLGDPIEFKALRSVYAQTDRDRSCFLGSVKANLGHLGACAGIVGLQKVLLMLRHGAIAPQINFSRPNPELGMEESAFQICTELRDWPEDSPRTAGISSFGLGGTNCHILVEGFCSLQKPKQHREQDTGILPICLSAKSKKVLVNLCEEWADFLASGEVNVHLAAATALTGRTALPWRFAITAATGAEAIRELKTPLKGIQAAPEHKGLKAALILEEPDSLAPSFGPELYQEYEAFRKAFNTCADQCAKMQGPDLAAIVSGQSPATMDDTRARRLLYLASVVSLAHLLASHGFVPAMIAGNGTGTLAAKVLSGTLSLEEGMKNLSGHNGQPDRKDAASREWALPGAELVNRPDHHEETFAKTVDACVSQGADLLVTMGTPIAALPNVGENDGRLQWVSVPSQPAEAGHGYARALADLHLAGVDLVPRARPKYVQCPQYPFAPTRYWPDKSRNFCDMLDSRTESADRTEPPHAETGKNSEQEDGSKGNVSIEQCMCDIWNQALGTSDITSDDDFFERGGSSLSAIAIVADIEKYTGLTIQLQELMQLRSIDNVIARLSQLAEEESRECCNNV